MCIRDRYEASPVHRIEAGQIAFDPDRTVDSDDHVGVARHDVVSALDRVRQRGGRGERRRSHERQGLGVDGADRNCRDQFRNLRIHCEHGLLLHHINISRADVYPFVN